MTEKKENENLIIGYYKIIEFIIERTEEIKKDIFLDKNLTIGQKRERLNCLEDLKEIMIQETLKRIKTEMPNKEIDKIYFDLMNDKDILEKTKKNNKVVSDE
jgi:hypothetical protein